MAAATYIPRAVRSLSSASSTASALVPFNIHCTQCRRQAAALQKKARNFTSVSSSSAVLLSKQATFHSIFTAKREYATDSTPAPKRTKEKKAPRKKAASENPIVASANEQLQNIKYRSESQLYDISNKKRRTVISNIDTARQLVKSMSGLSDGTKKNVTVIDLYAGEGYLSQALLELPNVKQVIAVEHVPSYIPKIQKILETSAGRLQHVALDPFWWDTYGVIQQRGLLEHVRKEPWAEEHSHLVLTGLIPEGLIGERLLVQFLNCIPEQLWFYDYGRFASHFIVPSKFFEKVTASPGSTLRQKLAVLLLATTDMKAEMTAQQLSPTQDHFKTYHKSNNKSASLQVLGRFVPMNTGFINTQEEKDVLEFLARNLFIHRTRSWCDSLKYLAPGAERIAQIMLESGQSVATSKRPRDLTEKEWQYMVAAFLKWPFRPTDLEQTDVKDADENMKYDKRI